MENLNDHTRLLAESQAREAQLREALQALFHDGRKQGWNDSYESDMTLAYAALEQPTDDTALQVALAVERAKVSDFVRNNYQDHNIGTICDRHSKLAGVIWRNHHQSPAACRVFYCLLHAPALLIEQYRSEIVCAPPEKQSEAKALWRMRPIAKITNELRTLANKKTSEKGGHQSRDALQDALQEKKNFHDGANSKG